MARLHRLTQRIALGLGVAILAVVAATAPLKPAAADGNWQHHGQWHRGGNWHGSYQGGYGGVYFYAAPRYYTPAPVYYYPPPSPVYYAPAPIYPAPAPLYGPPAFSLNFVIPLQFH